MSEFSEYAEFFLNSLSSVVQIETLVISHPDFSKDYLVVRNAVAGLSAKLETGATANFEYYPLRITGSGTRDNLDFGLKIDFGDLGETIPQELDRVAQANNFETTPTVVYRTYRSDDLEAPLFGPLYLEIVTINMAKEGATFEAKAPSLNINKTGEIYSLERFPMLRSFL